MWKITETGMLSVFVGIVSCNSQDANNCPELYDIRFGNESEGPAIPNGAATEDATNPDPRDGPEWPIALHQLLRLRSSLRTDRLDGAIRYLTRAGCGYRDNSEKSWVDDADVDQLFSLSKLEGTVGVGECGRSLLRDGSIICGELPLQRGLCDPIPKAGSK
jgi:hypothetical protein